jgi:arylformamidase
MKIYDISRTVSPAIAVWPGDQPFERRWTMRMAEGATVNVATITISTHTGTHADAPLHVDDAGLDIARLPLEPFLGPVVVIEIREADRIEIEHVQGIDLTRTPRVLFQTGVSGLPDDWWPERFPAIDPKLAEWLGEKDVLLVGTDAPSVDPAESRTLDVHKTLVRYGIVNLENLWLRDVPPGEYELIALPLKLAGLDATPVRAVLIAR